MNNDAVSYVEVSLNIQATYFEHFLSLLDSSGANIISRTFSVEDVTLQYMDDSTRLQNKKKLQKKYLDLLSRATDMKSTLEIEEKIEEIQTDIEVRESQVKVLERKINYSQFFIKIEKDYGFLKQEEKNKFTYKISQGLHYGWEGIKNSIVFLILIWPLYVLLAILILVRKYYKRRRANNNF